MTTFVTRPDDPPSLPHWRIGDALWTIAAAAGPLTILLFAYDVLHAEMIRPAAQQPRIVIASAALAFSAVGAMVAAVTCIEALVAAAFGWLTRRTDGRFGGLVPSVIGAIAGSPVLLLMARQPFIGNRYKDSPVAMYGPWVVFVGLELLAIAGIWCVTRLVVWLFTTGTRRRTRAVAAGVLLVGVIPIVAVDTLWYVGWYPLVHGGLSIAAVLLTHLALAALIVRSAQAQRVAQRITALTIALVVIAASAAALSGSPTARWRVVTGTLFAARVVQPAQQLTIPPISLDGLNRVPHVGPGDVMTAPAVMQAPPPLASRALLVTVDALRYDAVGLNAASGALTPKIDAFFSGGQVFHRAYSQYAATRHSVRAIIESRYHEQQDYRTDDLINRLRDYGFQVIAVLPSDMKTFVNVERYNFTKVAFYEDPSTVPSILDGVIRDVPAEKRFVWVHLYQTHDPYEPPPEFQRGTSSRDLYRGEVRWVDYDFGQIVSMVGADHGLTVFGADHGEEFREHGGTLHGRTVYDETIHVPLAVKVDGVPASSHNDLVANIDIAPTILAALGVPIPDGYEGYDLLRRASSAPPDRVVYSASVTNAVAVLRGTRKWIHLPDVDLWEAYDVSTDPRELHNLAEDAHVMEAARAYASYYELAEDVLPRLQRVGSGEYVRWLRQHAQSNESGALGRWAAYQVGKQYAATADVQRLLQDALQDEPDVAVKLALVDTLGAVPPGERIAVDRPDTLDPALLIEVLRNSALLADERAFVQAALRHRAAAVRTMAAERLAVIDPQAAVMIATSSTTDAATARGLMRGLAQRTADVPSGFFRRFVDNPDVEVRAAAIDGLGLQEATQAVPALEARAAVEQSPSVVKVILERLLSLDRKAGGEALRREIERPRLSDYTRAQIISAWNVDEDANHLLDLFVNSQSVSFRNYLFTAVTKLRSPPDRIRGLVIAMESHAFEPALRTRITSYLRGES